MEDSIKVTFKRLEKRDRIKYRIATAMVVKINSQKKVIKICCQGTNATTLNNFNITINKVYRMRYKNKVKAVKATAVYQE